MIDLNIHLEYESDARYRYIAEEPIDFETWLGLSFDLDKKLDTELIRGEMVQRMSAQYPHEWIFGWLFKVLGSFVSNRKLGIVLGSRTAVKISDTDGRLPDLLFVRTDNTSIIHKNAIYGVPDLVIEIVSENDRAGDLLLLETDYCSLGVPEIVFIEPKKQRVRILRKRETGYDKTLLTTGRLTFSSIPGFWIEVEWLFTEEKPDEFTITRQLIEAAEAQ